MRLHIRYVSVFAYGDDVWNSHNLLRACPVSDQRQQVNSYRLDIDPAASTRSHTDFWGTRVDAFSVRLPHRRLSVQAETVVDTSPTALPVSAELAALDDDSFRDAYWLFLQPTSNTSWPEAVSKAASEVAADATDVSDLVERMGSFVYNSLTYSPGATEIGVSTDEVWGTKAGVCQDFSHLTVAMLRSVGVPARYVSGYFYASDPSDASVRDDQAITVQTHAWVEAAVPGDGWMAIDPTNGAGVGERHVVIGRGRDYDDVTPLRGVYSGRTKAEVTAEVAIAADHLGPIRLPVVQHTFDQ